MSTEYMAEMLKILDKHLNIYFEKAVERLGKREDEDYDEVSYNSIFNFFSLSIKTCFNITFFFEILGC